MTDRLTNCGFFIMVNPLSVGVNISLVEICGICFRQEMEEICLGFWNSVRIDVLGAKEGEEYMDWDIFFILGI